MIVVESEFVQLDVPVVVTRGAGGIGGLGQLYLVFTLEVDPLGLATRLGRRRDFLLLELGLTLLEIVSPGRGKAGIPDVLVRLLFEEVLGEGFICRRLAVRAWLATERVDGLFEIADLILKLHAHFWPGDDVLVQIHAHIAFGLDFILDRPVGQAVGLDDGADLAQLGIALGDELAFDVALHQIGAEEDRARHRAVLRWLDHLAGGA